MDLDYNLKNWSSISKFFPCVCVGKSMKTDFGSAKRQRNEEQNNGQRHKKKQWRWRLSGSSENRA